MKLTPGQVDDIHRVLWALESLNPGTEITSYSDDGLEINGVVTKEPGIMPRQIWVEVEYCG